MSILNRKLYFLILLLCQNGFSQPIFKKTQIQATLGSIISGDSTTPFLIRSKQYGLVPYKSGIGYINLFLKKEYDSLYTTINRKLKRLDFGYGFETHLNFGKVNQVLLPVAHVKIRYGAFELYGGRRKEIHGLVDTTGTMGSYIWSGNALPMPKVELSIPNYTPILRNSLVSIKGNFAHGWFGKGVSVQSVLLRQKSFYARLGKPNWKVHLQAGFNHQVQWGGYPTKPFYDDLSKQTISRFNSDFSTFFKVAAGISLNNKGQGATSGAPANEALNRAGNHLGSVDIGLNLTLNKYNIFVYRQSFYEDGSLFYLNNITDGLNGIAFTRKIGIIKKITIEHLSTLNQGGSFHYGNIPELRGDDNYFHNSIYTDNWIYKSNIIGSPMILSMYDVPSLSDKSDKKNSIFNNRISAFSLNINYHVKSILFNTHLVKSENKGTFNSNLDLSQISFSEAFTLHYKDYEMKVIISSDYGELYKKNIGLNIIIKKNLNNF